MLTQRLLYLDVMLENLALLASHWSLTRILASWARLCSFFQGDAVPLGTLLSSFRTFSTLSHGASESGAFRPSREGNGGQESCSEPHGLASPCQSDSSELLHSFGLDFAHPTPTIPADISSCLMSGITGINQWADCIGCSFKILSVIMVFISDALNTLSY